MHMRINIPTAQIYIFVLFVSATDLFEGVFSLWVSLKIFESSQESTCAICFFIKVKACKFIKKRLQHKCFPVNFVRFLRTPFLQNTSGRLLLQIKWQKHELDEMTRNLNISWLVTEECDLDYFLFYFIFDFTWLLIWSKTKYVVRLRRLKIIKNINNSQIETIIFFRQQPQ